MSVSVERLGNEVVDLNGRFDNDTAVYDYADLAIGSLGIFTDGVAPRQNVTVQIRFTQPGGAGDAVYGAMHVRLRVAARRRLQPTGISSKLPFGGGVSRAATTWRLVLKSRGLRCRPPRLNVWAKFPANNPAVAPFTCYDKSMIASIVHSWRNHAPLLLPAVDCGDAAVTAEWSGPESHCVCTIGRFSCWFFSPNKSGEQKSPDFSLIPTLALFERAHDNRNGSPRGP